MPIWLHEYYNYVKIYRICPYFFFFFLIIRRPRRSPLFPYTTLFRSIMPPVVMAGSPPSTGWGHRFLLKTPAVCRSRVLMQAHHVLHHGQGVPPAETTKSAHVPD